MAKEEKRHRPRESALALAPVIAAAVFVLILLSYYYVLDVGGGSKIFVDSHSVNYTRGKLLFGVSGLGLTTALLWNMAIALIIVSQGFLMLAKSEKVARWIILLVLNVLVWILLLKFELGGAAVREFLAEIERTGAPIKKITMFNNLLAGSTILTIIFSLWALATPRGTSDVRIIGDRIYAFTLSIYSSAALLSFAIFEVYSLFYWGALLQAEGDAEAILSLANMLPIAAGVVFSTLMVIIYLPIAIIQHGWLKAHYADAAKDREPFDEWSSKHGLPSSPLNILGSYLAMLVPLGVGLVTKAIGA